MANLQTEFSLEDIKIARDVLNTYPCGLSRVALNAPDQVFRIGASGISDNHEGGMAAITFRTLKMQYAIEVWLRAIAISQDKLGSLEFYWWLNWKDRPDGFRELVYNDSVKYYDVDQDKLIAEFIDLLRHTADSGEIKVHEYCHPYLKTSFHDFADTCKTCYEVVVDARTACDIHYKTGPVADYNYSKADVSYCWNDIKDYFIVLTLNQLRLVNKGALHKQSLWDKVLFEGASECNIPMMQYAIDNGANPQSLDSCGESALVSAISNARFYEPDHSTAEIIETVDYLLSKGADINAFGADGIPPLMEAYYAKSPELVKILIERGADVNFNCYLLDCQYWESLKRIKSYLLYDIETDYSEDDSPETQEIEKIVRAAGARSTFEDDENQAPFH